MTSTGTRLGIFFAYLAFVVYGSLIPFELRPVTFDQAVASFGNIRWLDLGPGSRADWVANILLYIPLAFIGSDLVAGRLRSGPGRLIAVLFVVAICVVIAFAVEFAQIFFAPRTVSLNDLLAETLGSAIGGLVWLSGRRRLNELATAFASGGRQSVSAAIIAYLLAYVALALFPFDFAISLGELSAKMQSGRFGWLLADVSFRRFASLAAEVIAIAPLGVLVGLLAARVALGRTFVAGALLGLVLEIAQLFVLSSVTQGASVLARGIGLAAGAYIGQLIQRDGLLPLATWVRRLSLPLMPFYLVAVAAVTGWFSQPILGLGQGPSRFDGVQLIPFFFHYFSTEPAAMASLLANVVMYAPLGILVWSKHTIETGLRRRRASEAALVALFTALLFETSKLWLGGKHPDYTNLLIAMLGAVAAYQLASWIGRASRQVEGQQEAPPTVSAADARPSQPRRSRARRKGMPRPRSLALALTTSALLVFGVLSHPLAFPVVVVIVALYVALLWRWFEGWLFALPAVLPVLDLGPYAGRQLLDVFDLLVLATLTVGAWRVLDTPPRPWPGRLQQVAVGLLLASGLISTIIGLQSVLTGASPSLAHSHPTVEAFMVGKGLLWALALVPLLRRLPGADVRRYREYLVNGLAAGLALLAVAVALERQRFVGLGDFDGIFRVTGTFSSMNNGGAYIEAFIALAFPALAVWTIRQPNVWLRLAGVGAAALASYAMFVTFSRGGYGGLVVGLLVLIAGAWWSRHENLRRSRLWLVGVGLVVAVAATPVLLGGFAQGRLAQIERDLTTRIDHWGHAIHLMDKGPLTALFGMGFGQYPTAYLWRSERQPPPGTFAVQTEDDETFLRMGGGDPYYLDQIPGLKPGQTYRLEMRARFGPKTGGAKVSLCEKALLYSFRCNWFTVNAAGSAKPGDWQALAAQVHTRGLGKTGRWPGPTLKLSIVYPGRNGMLDIDEVRLVDSGGDDLLANGDFDNGLDRWLLATDRDLAWHIHQTSIEVYFAQGLLGLAALIISLFTALKALVPETRSGDLSALAIIAGLTGFVAVGLLGSTLDSARTSHAFYLIVVTAVSLNSRYPTRQQTQPSANDSI